MARQGRLEDIVMEHVLRLARDIGPRPIGTVSNTKAYEYLREVAGRTYAQLSTHQIAPQLEVAEQWSCRVEVAGESKQVPILPGSRPVRFGLSRCRSCNGSTQALTISRRRLANREVLQSSRSERSTSLTPASRHTQPQRLPGSAKGIPVSTRKLYASGKDANSSRLRHRGDDRP